MRFRHAVAIVAWIALAAGVLTAQQPRATFVLSDGERMTGSVVQTANTRARSGREEFSLRAMDGTDVPVPIEQVTMIQFAGGQPLDEELLAAPSDGHLLSLRSGDLRRGRLVGFVSGAALRWQNPRGGTVDVPLNQVRRIVLDGDRARELYGVGNTGGDRVDAGWNRNTRMRNRRAAIDPANTLTELGTVTVRSTTAWTDSGLTVQADDTLVFEPTGQIAFSRNPDHVAAPEGHGARAGREEGLPLETAPVGALIGKVGPRGRPFLIGAGGHDTAIPASGRLYLGVNDDGLDDNSGAFRVVVYR